MADADLLLRWRNDPDTRLASHHTGVVGPGEHLTWLSRTLADSDRRLLVAEEFGTPVGTVRIDRREGVSDLSWTVAPEARGRGVATRMVTQVVHELSGPIHAQVKAGHLASVRVAERAGLAFDRDAGGTLHFRRK
jgi:RimJ/RimL family protein N-acetyltransferase